MLDSIGQLSKTDLQGLVEQLSGLHPQYPPSKKPRFSAQKETPRGQLPSDYNDMVLNSMFNLLSMDDDSSSDDEDSSLAEQAAAYSSSSDVPVITPILTKYILVKVKCALAESTRNAAVAAQKQKNYNDCTGSWCVAYEIMNDVLTSTDPWAAELIHQGARIHNSVLVKEIVDGVSVLIEDTIREKDNAIGRLYQRQEFLHRKLNPQLEERNVVREKIGEEKWKNNLAPKMTYAERRKLTEQELRDVSMAITTIEPLVLIGDHVHR